MRVSSRVSSVCLGRAGWRPVVRWHSFSPRAGRARRRRVRAAFGRGAGGRRGQHRQRPASSSPCSAPRNNSHNWSKRSSTPRACRRGQGATDRDAAIAHRGLRPNQSTAAQQRLSRAEGIHDRRPFLAPPAQSRRMDRRREPHQGRARLLSGCTSHPSRSRAGRAVRTTRLRPHVELKHQQNRTPAQSTSPAGARSRTRATAPAGSRTIALPAASHRKTTTAHGTGGRLTSPATAVSPSTSGLWEKANGATVAVEVPAWHPAA
jgi:hypothetical protein